MKKILGIDLGTNSLGWALVSAQEKLLDGGVIIFPKGNNEDPKSGKESSYSQMRTAYRGARRRLYRRRLRRKRLLDLAQKYFQLEGESIYQNSDPLTLYKLRYEGLERILSPAEFFRVCLYFAKKRGFLSNRKDQMRDESNESGVVKKGIADLERTILEAGCRTLGEYYFKLITDHFAGRRLEERILERWTSRLMYMQEFDLIVANQLKLKSTHFSQSIFDEIRQEIFYQRPLKSAKHLVGKCRLESNKRCMPKSHPVFQEFRAWQIINNLRWANPDTSQTGILDFNQKKILFDYLSSNLKPTEARIKKLLGFSSRVKFTELELKSCTTLIQMNTILEDHPSSLSGTDKLAIYHALLFTMDHHYDKLKDYLWRKFNIHSNLVSKLWSAEYMKLEQDYSNISHKAAQKLLPFMRKGLRYDEACLEAGYHHSLENKFKNLDKIKPLRTNELRNPVVQKAVSVCIALVNNVIEKHGKPDEVRIELAKELKKPKSEREKIRSNNLRRQKQKDQYREVLEEHFGRTIAYSDSILSKYELWLELGCKADDFSDFDAFTKEVKKTDLDKYKLWLEADRISPYSGRVISLSQLINNSDIEIEHILPFSRSLDNSMANKTICERSINADKGNLTPMEYFAKKPSIELQDFKKRIVNLSNPVKRSIFLSDQLPDSFSNNQLSDTAYIAQKAVEKISECIQKVYTIKGKLTYLIRKEYGLNSILHYEGTSDFLAELKNRGDHRHHFIDAAVIATTDNATIQKISREAEYANSRMKLNLPMPWNGFRTEVEEMVNGLLVVHKFPKKLIRNSLNKYKHDKRKNKVTLVQKALRGSMHEDTLYGKIHNPYTGSSSFVVTKKLDSLDEKQLSKIVDKGIREYLFHLIKKEGDWSKIIKNPIYFNGKPLRRVRWINTSSDLPMLRTETRSYIEPGNNYCLVIYESASGKRDYINLSFFEAIKNKKESGRLYPELMEDKQMKFSLTHYDKFIIYNQHPDEIDWSDRESLNERLYHVIKFTGNSIFLGKSNCAKIQADKDKMPLKLYFNSNTIKAVKVKLNNLGEIIWRSDIDFNIQA